MFSRFQSLDERSSREAGRWPERAVAGTFRGASAAGNAAAPVSTVTATTPSAIPVPLNSGFSRAGRGCQDPRETRWGPALPGLPSSLGTLAARGAGPGHFVLKLRRQPLLARSGSAVTDEHLYCTRLGARPLRSAQAPDQPPAEGHDGGAHLRVAVRANCPTLSEVTAVS